jgi:integrase
MPQQSRKPRLMTADLERYIERVHLARTAEAAERERIDAALAQAWASPGGRAFRRFLDTRPTDATRRVYRLHVADYLNWLVQHAGAIDPLDATPEDLARYERDVSQRVSARTKRRMALRSRQERVRTIRTAYQFCVDEDLILRSPARHVRIRGRAEPRRVFLADEDVSRLIAACEGKRISDARDRLLITFLLHTGLRAAELAALTWGAVDGDAPATLTVEGKGRVVRTVPLSAEASRALDEWANVSGALRSPDRPIWTRVSHRVSGDASRNLRSGSWSITASALAADSVHAIVTRRAARAGLAGVTPHALRRTFATKLRDLGVAIDTISRYLGHASVLTTVGYFDTRDEGAARTVRGLSYDSVS